MTQKCTQPFDSSAQPSPPLQLMDLTWEILTQSVGFLCAALILSDSQLQQTIIKHFQFSSNSTLCSSCSVVKLYSFSRRMTGRMSRLGPRINHNLDLCSSQPTNLILSERNYLCLFLSRLQLLTCQI